MRGTPRRLGWVATGLAALGAVVGCDDAADGAHCPDRAGVICPWAGTGAPGFDGDGHSLSTSRFYWPVDLTFTTKGEVFILDWNNHRVRHLTPGGVLETVIGTDFVGDGDEALADLTAAGALATDVLLNHPTQLIELGDGTLLLDAWHNHKLRTYDPATGRVRVLCGRGAGFAGDGGPVADALLNQPSGIRRDALGRIYILDQRNQRIRRIDSTGDALDPQATITTVVGDGQSGFAGDGGDPLAAEVSFPPGSNPQPAGSLTFDTQGRLYFSDTLNDRVRRVDLAAGSITTVLGNGDPATLDNPRDVELGPDGRIYVADEKNSRVLALDVDTLAVTVVAGTGTAGNDGDFGPATAATLDHPTGLAFDAAGDLYIADTLNSRIRRVRLGAGDGR